jgi:mono/diheme cytochrome c family protein
MKKILKGMLWVAVAAIALGLLAATVLWVRGGAKLALRGELEVPPIALPAEPAALARGAHLAAVYCAECHGTDYGGKPLLDDPGFMVLDAPNLTRGAGGLAADFDGADWDRAIRHGLGARGNALLIMPSAGFYHLTDEDVGAIAAHLRTVPPVDRQARPRRASLVARLLTGAGAFDHEISYAFMDHAAPRLPRPPAEPTAEHGAYLVRTLACGQCHGEDLAGRPLPGPGGVIAANLTPAGPIGAWSEDLFLRMVATRVSERMPWPMLRAMDEVEQRAVWRHLATLPPTPTAAAD